MVVTGLWPRCYDVPLLSPFLEHGTDWLWCRAQWEMLIDSYFFLVLVQSSMRDGHWYLFICWGYLFLCWGVALERQLFGNPHLEVRITSRELFPRCCWYGILDNCLFSSFSSYLSFAFLYSCTVSSISVFLQSSDHADCSQHAQSYPLPHRTIFSIFMVFLCLNSLLHFLK